MSKIRLLIVLFLAVLVCKMYKKINFPIVLSRLSVLKQITEVSMSCILCCKFKNVTSMYELNQNSGVFVFSFYLYVLTWNSTSEKSS